MATRNSSPEGIHRLNELLERVSANDGRAFAELYNLTRHKMRMIVLSVSPSLHECEDLLQEGYVKIWRNAGRFDPSRASPITWMSVIMRNTAIDALRRRAIPTAELDEALSVASAPDQADSEDFDLDLARPMVVEALRALSSDRRRLIELAYLNGESRAALSRRFGVPVGTIKTWLRRSLQSVQSRCLAATQALDATTA
jgi:RNA polymerase sigma-70 factor (ECF subfamily)